MSHFVFWAFKRPSVHSDVLGQLVGISCCSPVQTPGFGGSLAVHKVSELFRGIYHGYPHLFPVLGGLCKAQWGLSLDILFSPQTWLHKLCVLSDSHFEREVGGTDLSSLGICRHLNHHSEPYVLLTLRPVSLHCASRQIPSPLTLPSNKTVASAPFIGRFCYSLYFSSFRFCLFSWSCPPF